MIRGQNLCHIQNCLPRLHIFTMAYIHIHLALHKQASGTLHHNLRFIHQYHAYTTPIFIFAYAGKLLQETAGEMLILSHAEKKSRIVIKFKKQKTAQKTLTRNKTFHPWGFKLYKHFHLNTHAHPNLISL